MYENQTIKYQVYAQKLAVDNYLSFLRWSWYTSTYQLTCTRIYYIRLCGVICLRIRVILAVVKCVPLYRFICTYSFKADTRVYNFNKMVKSRVSGIFTRSLCNYVPSTS